MTEYLLGIDCGLTRTKAVLHKLDGTPVSMVGLATHLVSGPEGIVEMSMTGQWATAVQAVSQVLKAANIRSKDIGAVGLTGYGNGLYGLNRSQEPVGNAITSMDHRALAILQQIPADIRDWLHQTTLQHLWEAQPAILLRWLKEHEPDQYRKIAHILFCKDWIRFCLTGEISSELSDMSGGGLMNNSTRRYEQAILEAHGVPEINDCLPHLLPSTAVAGRISAEAASLTGLLAGTPVISGLFDVVSNPLGSGLIGTGRLCSIMGTWNINMALSETPVKPQKFRQCTIYADDRLYACIDSSATSASNLEWILNNVLHEQVGYDEFEKIVSGYKADDLSLYFMPFIYGGLAPGNPGAAFFGLRSEHTHADMLRAVAEGVAFAHAYHIQNLKRESLKGDEVLLTGGASRNRAWCQLMADILQMPVIVPRATETGALGACLVAGIGAGCFQDIREGATQMVKIEATYHPQSDTASIYESKFQRFIEILDWMSI